MKGITIWRVGESSECSLSHASAGNIARCGPHNAFTATAGSGFGTSATSYSSTLSGTATSALNGTLVECFGPDVTRDADNMVGNSTLQILGQYVVSFTYQYPSQINETPLNGHPRYNGQF